MRAAAARRRSRRAARDPTEIVAVGGTASNLIKVARAATLDRTLTRDRIAERSAHLTAEPAAAARERHSSTRSAARILPAGAVIVDAMLRRYGVDALRVSEAGHPRGRDPRAATMPAPPGATGSPRAGPTAGARLAPAPQAG